MKKLLLTCISALALLVSANAATTATTVTATNAVVLDGPYILQSVTILQATNGIVRLYDDDAKTLTNLIPANIVVRSYVTNVVDTWVQSGGTTNSATNTVIWYYSVTNAAAAGVVPAFATLIGAVNNPVTETFNRTLQRGLVVSNATSGDIIVKYRSQ